MTTTRAQEILLLRTKKQIILYGPPGTGKTYSTKRLAVSLIVGCDFSNTLKENDELPDKEPNAQKKAADSPLFNKMESSIKNLSGIELKPQPTMIGFYSFSKKKNKKMGLVWLDYPKTGGPFRVHFRKEKENTKYPQEIVSQMTNYRPKGGFGDHPYCIVKSDQDADNAISLIQYAYENL